MSVNIRTSSIAARAIIKKLPVDIRPNENDLYRFLDGKKHLIPKATRKKMVAIMEKDFQDMKEYLTTE